MLASENARPRYHFKWQMELCYSIRCIKREILWGNGDLFVFRSSDDSSEFRMVVYLLVDRYICPLALSINSIWINNLEIFRKQTTFFNN